ncbi:hypothetical protein [Mangrovicoccus sp. HB161399]|uniref:hypothetical protein n=1 Tax=Mangrovicoccus sp. HB161399 TaxID=2720392 RepID=UPI001555D123|nr:hypothetical protein [Mangrovicoccus sp. HB161399]
MKSAIEQGDHARVAFILGGGGTVSRGVSAPDGNRQLARALDLEPGQYDAATLAALHLEATGGGSH